MIIISIIIIVIRDHLRQSDILRIETGPGGPELQLFHRAVHELIENLRLKPRNEP